MLQLVVLHLQVALWLGTCDVLLSLAACYSCVFSCCHSSVAEAIPNCCCCWCCLQGKHMSEQLVTRYQTKQQLPVAIVRPSLVSAIAGEAAQHSPSISRYCLGPV
jgi:hypothetical protein